MYLNKGALAMFCLVLVQETIAKGKNARSSLRISYSLEFRRLPLISIL
jgi:hypothetical protein